MPAPLRDGSLGALAATGLLIYALLWYIYHPYFRRVSGRRRQPQPDAQRGVRRHRWPVATNYKDPAAASVEDARRILAPYADPEVGPGQPEDLSVTFDDEDDETGPDPVRRLLDQPVTGDDVYRAMRLFRNNAGPAIAAVAERVNRRNGAKQ